ncbi:Protein N-acetyltransferase, RimJ/RimL family [Nonlabens sp. Hel1_33_55]|uniref:GNAT family N-acetyltransferase n=1 Tax=Nonlabens sp. Hel1_33_55 TaxID=1336802 RepID=UPI000875E0AC|nr:GNAT family protein [Nonlabens sp. Hel1_33_55]SCX94277.1 Protein N-acetyltransferase, RimJ/RimL family [Nonlabens sp. Hel1_33_55]
MMNFKIGFRAFEVADSTFINALRNLEDYENSIGGNKRFVSKEREQKWVEDLIFNDYQDRIYMAIYEAGDEARQIIGYTSISDIDHVNKSCFWSGIKIHPDFSGKGYGTQTALLILKYVFQELNMERCTGECLENHPAVKKMLEKVGYSVEGLKRHSLFKSGEYQNQFLFSILKSEFIQVKSSFDL